MNGTSGRDGRSMILVGLLSVVAVILAAYALKATAVVTMPLAFALFSVMLLEPVARWFNHLLGGRRVLSLTLTMLVFVAAVSLFAFAAWVSVELTADKLPQYIDQLNALGERFAAWAESRHLPLKKTIPPVGELGKDALNVFASGLASALSVPAAIVLIFFLVLLALIELPEWQEKTARAFDGPRSSAILDTVRTIAGRSRRFIAVHAFISLISGIAAGTWLLLLGVDFAVLWGLLTILLNFIPYVGSVIAVFPPFFTAVIQKGFGFGLVTIGGLVVIDQFMGNYVDPRLVGRVLSLSPVVLLVAVMFWGWTWGVAGALLAVPITIVIRVACEHIPALRSVAVLLSRGRKRDEGTGT